MRRRRIFEGLTAALLAVLMIGGEFAMAAPPAGKGSGKTKVALILTIQPASVSEGTVATGTVTHNNADLNSAVIVSLETSDATEATVPETVTIPSGSSSIAFPVTALNDMETDGDQAITITTAATSYQSGSASLTVMDVANLPPIEYVPHFVTMPIPEVSIMSINDFNDSGTLAGRYQDPATGVQQGFLSFSGDEVVFNVNNLPIVGLDQWSTDLDPLWTISSVVGINGNGLVVGYVSPIDDSTHRRGFVLDLETMCIHQLPDGGLSQAYARKVNDKGDVLGQFVGEDGLHYAYLINIGLRGGAAFEMEIIDTPVSLQSPVISNPPVGEPSQIVGMTNDYTVFQYTLGGTAFLRTDYAGDGTAARPVINDWGDIAGKASRTIELKGNKTQTDYFVWRDVEGVVDLVLPQDNDFPIYGMNNFGTIANPNLLYNDSYGSVKLSSVAPEQYLDYSMQMNNTGLFGFGQLAGTYRDDSGETIIVVLTPVEVQR